MSSVEHMPRRARRRYKANLAVWGTRPMLAEISRLHRLYADSDSTAVRDELLHACEDALRAWTPVQRAAELGDLEPGGDREYARLSGQIATVARLIDQLAPQPAETSSDWALILRTPAVGERSARTKLRRVVGKHLADGSDPALARDHAHRLNESCIPPLKTAAVNELVDQLPVLRYLGHRPPRRQLLRRSKRNEPRQALPV